MSSRYAASNDPASQILSGFSDDACVTQVNTEAGHLHVRLAASTMLTCGFGQMLKLDLGSTQRATLMRDGIAIACHELALHES